MIWEDVKSELKKLVVVAAVIVVVAIVGFAFLRRVSPAKYEKDVAKSEQLDTAHVERAKASAKLDSAVHTARRIDDKAMKEADRIHQVADTAGQNALTVRDSLEMWRKRDSLHVIEIDSLRRVHRSDSLQKLLLTRDRDDWKHHSDSVVTAMDNLRGDLKKAQADQCRILPFVPCLSRKESLVAGVVVGAVIAAHPQETAKAVRKIFTLGR
jgi:hypothetical protein